MEVLYKFEDLLLDEIESLVEKRDLSPTEIERGKMAVCAIKEIEEAMAMSRYSGDEYSEAGRSYDNMSGARGRSARTGRYISNDSSRMSYTGRNSYNNSYNSMTSNHDRKDMIMDLEMEMNKATNDRDRQTIADMISILQQNRH